MNKGKYRIVALVLAFLLICPFLPVQNAFADGAEDASATQTQTQTQTDPNQWVRVLRDYTDSVEIGNYYYYFSKNVNGSTYKVYRGEKESYKEKLILKFKSDSATTAIYTDGKRLIYTTYNGGDIVKCKNLRSGKTKTILSLKKFRTKNSTDSIGMLFLYGNNLYYSKYRGLGKQIYKLYRVNINTGKQKTLKKKVQLTWTNDYYASGRFFPYQNKKGAVKIYDTKTGKSKSLSSGVKYIVHEDGYWYFLKCKKKKGSKRTFTVYRKADSGVGSAKKICTFKAKYTPDDIMEMNHASVTFFGSGKYSKEYNFKKKKLITRKDKDMWYYVNKEMFYS